MGTANSGGIVLRLLSSLLFIFTLSAADLTGRWEGNAEFKRSDGTPGGMSIVLSLKHSGQDVTGSIGPNADEQVPIQKGKFDGQKLTFEITADDRVYKLELTLAADKLEGQAKGEDGSGNPMTAKLSLARAK
jgi:hypothetical protein